MVLVYKMLKGKCIEKPIKGKNARDETTESKDSGFNFDSETEGELKETRKKGRIRAKKRRLIVESKMSDSETESLEEKPVKKRKGKSSGKKAQKKNTKKGSNSDFNYVLVESEEEDEENKRIDSKDKEGEGNLVKDNLETVNTTSLHNEEKGGQSDSGDKNTIKAFCETVATMVKDINSLKIDTQAMERIIAGGKPLAEHVKELVVILHNAEAIECMVGKILATKKKVNEMGDRKEMENKLKDFGSRIDRLEHNVKQIADQNFQILKSSMDNMNIFINRFKNNAEKDGDKE